MNCQIRVLDCYDYTSFVYMLSCVSVVLLLW